MLKSTGVSHFEAKFGQEGYTDVTHILMLSGRDMGLPYAKKLVLISSAI